MFDIGWSELLLVAVLAIVFVGPKDLPRVMRVAGQYVARMRAMAREFQQSFEDLARESELDDLRKEVEALRRDTMTPLPSTAEKTASVTSGLAETSLARPLPDDIDPAMAEAIRESREIEAFGEKAEHGEGEAQKPGDKPGMGQA